MNKNLRTHRIIILFFLCLLALGCWCKKSILIVPIREAEFREENFLPLDDSEINSIIKFIARGGQKAEGFLAELNTEPFQRLLQFFKEESNLTYGVFISLPELKKFIDTDKPVWHVIDAREEKGAHLNNRLAYRFDDFWFVLMIDKIRNEDGSTIKDNERRFSRLIVMKVLDRKKGIK